MRTWFTATDRLGRCIHIKAEHVPGAAEFARLNGYGQALTTRRATHAPHSKPSLNCQVIDEEATR